MIHEWTSKLKCIKNCTQIEHNMYMWHSSTIFDTWGNFKIKMYQKLYPNWTQYVYVLCQKLELTSTYSKSKSKCIKNCTQIEHNMYMYCVKNWIWLLHNSKWTSKSKCIKNCTRIQHNIHIIKCSIQVQFLIHFIL